MLTNKDSGFCKEGADIDDQCILVHNIDKLSKSSGHLKSMKVNDKVMSFLNGSAASFISTLKRGINRQTRPLLDITPAELSLLAPMIKLYRVEYTSKEPKKFKRQVPIKFRDHVHQSAVDSVLKTGRGRLGNVGIESVSIQQAGTTSAGTGYYTVSINLFAESIESFFSEQENENYLDLISYRPKKRRDDPDANKKVKDPNTQEKFPQEQVWDPLNYELKAIFGWAVPVDKTKMIRKPVQQALKNCQMLMRLMLNSHTIDFKEDGTVRISIDYHAALEGLLDSFRADLFHDPALITERASSFTGPDDLPGLKEAQDEARERAQAEGIQNYDPEKATGELKERLARARAKREIRGEQISRIYQILEQKGSFRYMTPQTIEGFISIVCDPEKLKEYGQRGALSLLEDEGNTRASAGGKDYTKASTYLKNLELEKQKSKIQEQTASAARPDNLSTKNVKRSVTRTIPFVYLANIVDAVNELIQDKNKLPASTYAYRVLLGPLEYVDRLTKERKTINLGQIPVSMHSLNKFINGTIIKTGVTSMSYMVFLKKLIKELAVDSLGRKCYLPGADLLKQSYFKSSVDATMITTTPKGGKDPFAGLDDNVINIAELGETFGTNPGLFSKKEAALSEKTKTFDYLIIYASYLPIPYRDGNRLIDERDGIYHLFLGQDKGMVKSINFSKMNMPSRRLYLMRNEVSQIDQLIERYNAQVELFGMPTMIPGQLVHINPAIASLGDSKNPNSYGSRLGLTGYYYITRITHSIASNTNFDTRLECSGMGPILGTSKPITKLSSTSDASSSKGKGPDDSKKKPKKGQNDKKADGIPADQMIALANDAFSIVHGTSATSMKATVANTFQIGSSNEEGISSVPEEFLNKFRTNPATGELLSPPAFPENCSSHLNGDLIARALINHLNSVYSPPLPTPPYSAPPANYNFYDVVMYLDGMVFESNFEKATIRPGPAAAAAASEFKQEYDLPYTAINARSKAKTFVTTEDKHSEFLSTLGSDSYVLQAVIPKDKSPLNIDYQDNNTRAFASFKFTVPRSHEEMQAIQQILDSGRALPDDVAVVEKTYFFSCYQDPALGWFIYEFREKAPREIKLPTESIAWAIVGGLVGVAAVAVDIYATGGVGTATVVASGLYGEGGREIQEARDEED